MNEKLRNAYENMGISDRIVKMADEIEDSLKERFEEIDAIVECNQLKVLSAMQKHKLSDIHFAGKVDFLIRFRLQQKKGWFRERKIYRQKNMVGIINQRHPTS